MLPNCNPRGRRVATEQEGIALAELAKRYREETGAAEGARQRALESANTEEDENRAEIDYNALKRLLEEYLVNRANVLGYGPGR
jgi:hypothetical protein